MSTDVTSAFKNAQEQRRLNLLKSFGYQDTEISKSQENGFSAEQNEIMKGLMSENPFERELAQNQLEKSNMSDIEKSDIMDAISYSDAFKIEKTGKEIKDQINSAVLPQLQAELAVKKSEADKILTECGDAPTNDLCSWWTRDMRLDISYKRYIWEECHCCEKRNSISNSLSWESQESIPKLNCPKTEAEALARDKYNRTIQIICEIMVDIKACEILQKNLKDTDSIKLSPRQLITFNFN